MCVDVNPLICSLHSLSSVTLQMPAMMFCLSHYFEDFLLFRFVLGPQTILRIMLRVENMLGSCIVHKDLFSTVIALTRRSLF